LRRGRGLRLLALLAGCFWVILSTVDLFSDELHLGVTRKEAVKIPLGIVKSEAGPELEPQFNSARSVLEMDLTRSLVFNLVETEPILANEPSSSMKEALNKKLGAAGIEVLVWLTLTQKVKDLVLEAQVYDGTSGQWVFGKRYLAQAPFMRAVVHRLADDLVLQYTGQPGIAETRIAYTSDKTGYKEIYLMDYDGYNPRRITGDHSLDLFPRWTPDGKSLVYTSYKDGRPEIYLQDLATGRRRKMVGFPGLNISPSWSPLGTLMAFATTKDGDAEIYTMDSAGKNFQPLTVGLGANLSPSWSPTGNEIAFNSDRGGSPQIYIMNSDGANVRRLTFEGDYNTSPAWSPKGDRIAYVCRTDDRLKICLIGPDGTGLAELGTGSGDDESPSWAPDGQHLVFSSNRSGNSQLYLINLDGTGLEPLTKEASNQTGPAWSPN
jgi:TolB protein